ncbi:PEP-CTERM sorting domain-containing protein [Lusitaniella coriacea LEGE 07157]|uniref:PEP-CTERM sorting domain-containing protein n=1 Tax=Lusitaniella coriacea LEGE 07157 TaxID=945747 RepID=A0A8J7DW56_9CYAN|nr:PEP-CTERM sorting domain-containing protein [Lusitaniella coriacea]MBE9116242.1 PEP-CTERM sorting domain-containing protein [Lusitaniella coriacea LEGE 07157]
MVTFSNILKQTSIVVTGAITLAFGTMGADVQAAKFFDSVINFTPGSGSGIGVINGSSYDGSNGPGTYDPFVVTSLDGASLGLGGAVEQPGSIILGFSDGSSLIDGDGVDLKLYDSFGLSEGFTLDIGNDGSNWFNVSTFDGSSAITQPFLDWRTYITEVDIASAGLTSAKFIRITAAPYSLPFFPEAYDLDAVEALNYAFIPESGSDSGNSNTEESGDSSSGGNNSSDGNTNGETPSNETSVPEPTSILGLFALGIFGIGANRKRS